MANFNLSIDLMKFWGAKVTTTNSGVEVVVIPINENKLKKTDRGSVLAYMQATEKKQVGQYGDTHFIKPRFSKDAFASLSSEQRNAIPFIGSVYATTNGTGNNGGQQSYSPSVNANDLDDSIF